MRPNEWAEQSRTAHPVQCKCDGCSGARKAREAKGVNPRSGHWYSKYSGK